MTILKPSESVRIQRLPHRDIGRDAVWEKTGKEAKQLHRIVGNARIK